MEYEDKRKRIREIINSFSEEEKLRWAFDTPCMEANDIGKAILKMKEKCGSVKEVAQELGVAEDWLNYYIQHLNLNEPAKPVVNTKDWKENFQRVRRKK